MLINRVLNAIVCLTMCHRNCTDKSGLLGEHDSNENHGPDEFIVCVPCDPAVQLGLGNE